MTRLPGRGLAVLALWLSFTPSCAQEGAKTYTYREVDGQALNAFVFLPEVAEDLETGSAVLLFHGGGWTTGSPEWTFETARRFADLGLVAISVEYRLSIEGVSPIDALSDVCAAFQWARRHANELGLREDRLAGYGVSAGGHLVAATATVGCPDEDPSGPSSRPDALLLWSPALDVTIDSWFRGLLQDGAGAAEYSPAQHVSVSTPPTSIVHGEKDTLTPLSGAKRYCDRLIEQGVVCKLHVYDGLGHLLTRNLANQESDFDPDPEARADGIAQHERFLAERGFIRR